MPSRIVREGINSSPRINALSMGAENLYRRLMLVADDYGRYYANPSTIRGACWPTHPDPPSEADISSWLAECGQLTDKCPSIDRNLLSFYEVNGCRYLEIVDFNQRIRSGSKFPQSAGNCQQSAGTTRARTHTSTNNEIRNTEDEGRAQIAVNPGGERFSEWIRPWPRVSDADAAARAWLSLVIAPDDEMAAFAARDRYLASDEVSRGVVMAPHKFLFEQGRNGWAGKWPPKAPPVAERTLKAHELSQAIDRRLNAGK